MKKYGLLAGLLVMFLSACSHLPSWVGDKPSPKLKGERISVFQLESVLKPDHNLEKLQVTLPVMGTSEHLQLTGNLKSISTFDIGKGTGGKYSLSAVPLIVDNAIYTLDAEGNVSAYEVAKGNKKLWKKNILLGEDKRVAGGGLAYASGKLFVTAGSEEVIALNSVDGQELWRRAVGNVVRAAPFAKSEGVFVTTIDNHLYAIDSRDGRIVWTHAGAKESIGVFGSASPLAAERLLIVPYSSGELYALYPATGEELWSGSLGYNAIRNAGVSLSDIDVAPVLSNGVLYAAGNAGVIYAIDVATSKRLWHQNIENIRGVWPAGDFLYVVGGDNEVICLHAQEGDIKWVAQLPRFKDEAKKKGRLVLSGPVLAGERLLVVESSGVLFSVSPYDGQIIEKTKLPKDIMLPPVIAQGNVYLLSNDAKLTVVQ